MTRKKKKKLISQHLVEVIEVGPTKYANLLEPFKSSIDFSFCFFKYVSCFSNIYLCPMHDYYVCFCGLMITPMIIIIYFSFGINYPFVNFNECQVPITGFEIKHVI